jgi:inner membrane protein
MDSVSQIALGAAVGIAVMGRRTAVWKAAAWGAVAGTLPDLDVLIDYGNPVHDMVLHRAETHAPFWLTLFSLPFAAAVARLHGEWGQWQRWWLALWLALVTHPLLDTMTVYGTQIGLPFTNRPFGVGSVFIIDPLYTLPLLIGTGLAWALWRRPWAPAANAAGLVLSCAYLVWGVAAQAHVQRVAQASLAAQGLQAERMLVTPTAFNSVAWRIVVMQREHYLEGFYSLRDAERRVHFDRFERGTALEPELRGIDGFERIAAFSRGFYALRQDGKRVLITDLRMGQEPTYTFSFAVAERASPARALAVPVAVGRRPDVDRLLPWLGRRIGGDPTPPPR